MTEAGEALREVLDKLLSDQSWKVEDYLKKLKQMDDGFDYRIATNNQGEAQGVVWQTPYMRGNFKLFGMFFLLMPASAN